MPIRTNRGRAAVYRKLWGWPLRSPTHLLVAALLVAILAVTVAFLLPEPPPSRSAADERESASRTGTTEETTTAGSGQSAVSRLSGPERTPSSVPPAPEALQVAENWARAWVDHPDGVSNTEWLDGLRPYTTDEYLPVMSSVNPANVPATEVTGEPRATRSHPRSAEVTVGTNGGRLTLTVIRTPDGWRVTGYTGGD